MVIANVAVARVAPCHAVDLSTLYSRRRPNNSLRTNVIVHFACFHQFATWRSAAVYYPSISQVCSAFHSILDKVRLFEVVEKSLFSVLHKPFCTVQKRHAHVKARTYGGEIHKIKIQRTEQNRLTIIFTYSPCHFLSPYLAEFHYISAFTQCQCLDWQPVVSVR